MNKKSTFFTGLLLFLLSCAGFGQPVANPCGTPAYGQAMNASSKHPNLAPGVRNASPAVFRQQATTVFVPVVFHLVLADTNLVRDAQILAQLSVLNACFAGTNGDSVQIPPYFKALVGKSRIQFCLASQTPDGRPTTGIVRRKTAVPTFGRDDAVKHAATGGDDAWNTDAYYNVWVCNTDVSGYATFPDGNAPAEQGVVVSIASLPGSQHPFYGMGKTLVHETGHFFNLLHIWGNGGLNCTGTDEVDDTPPQAGATLGCPGGMLYDGCTPGGFGIQYQNYMDGSSDSCKLLFTAGQVVRMETALQRYRPGLMDANGCAMPRVNNLDAGLYTLTGSDAVTCGPTFTPQVTVANAGLSAIGSLQLGFRLDEAPAVVTAWNGSLAPGQRAVLRLRAVQTDTGRHRFRVWVAAPNGLPDQNNANDTLAGTFVYRLPVESFEEGFEDTVFPPAGWQVINPDGAKTWTAVQNAAHTGHGAVSLNNTWYALKGQPDDLRLPYCSLPKSTQRAVLRFFMAAEVPEGQAPSESDTLSVLASVDCGLSNVVLYKKWGDALKTESVPMLPGIPVIPTAAGWRRDSVDLSSLIGKSNILLTFRNINRHVSTIFLDDFSLDQTTASQNASAAPVRVFPNPATATVVLRLSRPATGLTNLTVYDVLGKKVRLETNPLPVGPYEVRLSVRNLPSGTYVLTGLVGSEPFTEKIVKY